MLLRTQVISLISFALVLSTVACDRLRPDADGKATVTAASAPPAEPAAAPSPAPSPTTATVVATPTATVAVTKGATTTTVVNGNRAIKVQNGPNGLQTDYAGPAGSGAVHVGPNGVKVQGANGTVVVPNVNIGQ